MHLPSGVQDLQYASPRVALSLDAVGVCGVERTMTLGGGSRFLARIDASADLTAARMGVHMSRFHELFAEIVDEVLDGEAAGVEQLAEHIARRVADRQESSRASVRIRARVELPDRTPVSDLPTHEPVELIGLAHVAHGSARRAVGVSAHGINACPCAQGLVRARAEERLAAAGFTPDQVELALDSVPIATHNQRGTGTLIVGTDASLDPARLASIVRESMSGRIHELLKRADELHVVEQAHANPRFVEDSVREMLAAAADAELGLRDDDLLCARQVNQESIHAHDVYAERTALVREVRAELVGELADPDTAPPTLEAWLAGA